VTTEGDRSSTGAGLVMSERSRTTAVGAEVDRAGAERPEMQTGGDLGVRELEHRPKGDDAKPAPTEDRTGLGDRVARKSGKSAENALEPELEDLVASSPLGDDRPVIVDIEG
jgi:hypothetical protein